MDFDEYTDELVAKVRDTEGVLGLILLGSTTSARAAARDQWSDHDFYAVLAEGRQHVLRRELPFLPFRDELVAVAHDGTLGVSALYRDGHLFEFAAGTASELDQFRIVHHEIVYDAGDIDQLTAAAVRRGRTVAEVDAADQVVLCLTKVMLGVGRSRRGELVNGGSFVRTYAIDHFAAAVVTRLPPETPPARDGLDVVRRFEECHPSISRPLGAALDTPVERAAHAVYRLLRTTLEPGWVEFPSAAADVVAGRLGWSD